MRGWKFGSFVDALVEMLAKTQRAKAVRMDWASRLPDQKGRLFKEAVDELETHYSMLTVALSNSIQLREEGRLAQAREGLFTTAELATRLVQRMRGSLEALEGHGRHFGTLPNVMPLNAEYYRGETAKRMAAWAGVLQTVLFSTRPRFFHKVHTLQEMVEAVSAEFKKVAEEIMRDVTSQSSANWKTLDALHYDLNTCLRETIVTLKSFLCALPESQVEWFQNVLGIHVRSQPQTGNVGI